MDNLSQLFGKILHLNEGPETELPSILPQHSIKGIAEYIQDKKCSNIIVLTGAGISTAAGIPDFRSPGSGLYHNLKEYNLPYPEAVFNIDFFKKNPEPFFKLARFLWPEKLKPTIAHYFIRLLFEKNLLLRNYTQNIDTLELLAGIPEQKVIEAHGSFRKGKCSKCGHVYNYTWLKENIFNDPLKKVPEEKSKSLSTPIVSPPLLPDNNVSNENHTSQPTLLSSDKGEEKMADAKNTILLETKKESSRRSERLQNKTGKNVEEGEVKNVKTTFSIPKCTLCGGVVKPDIVFFGEPLPPRFFTSIRVDFPKCDLLIIMGSSLVVQPFASLVDYVKLKVPRLLINKEKTSAHASLFRFLGITKGMDFENDSKTARDVFWKGTCDDGCKTLINLLGWDEDLKRIMNEEIPELLGQASNATSEF